MPEMAWKRHPSGGNFPRSQGFSNLQDVCKMLWKEVAGAEEGARVESIGSKVLESEQTKIGKCQVQMRGRWTRFGEEYSVEVCRSFQTDRAASCGCGQRLGKCRLRSKLLHQDICQEASLVISKFS